MIIKQMPNILLTGGRAPAALALARVFYKTGHTVFMAESLRGNLSQPSHAIKQNFFVPPPRQQTDEFIRSLRKIIIENKVDLLIPTGEESFYVAMGRDQFPCTVFIESLKKMDIVRNKWYFIVTTIEFDLYAPETMLIANQDDLLQAFAQWRELVLKPLYSRFATRTLNLPTLKQALTTLRLDPSSHWIAQEHLSGQRYRTFSLCHHGRITAHTTYPSQFTDERGELLVFKHVDHPAIFNWVNTYVEKNQFTGQIAFDFIETTDGRLSALECIPYTTNGVHLLASNPKFVDAFFNPHMTCVLPSDRHAHMLSTAMLINGLPAAIKQKQAGKWLSTFLTSDDVILNYKDPLPFLLQFRSFFSYLLTARKNKITPLEAQTFDIEWNGGQPKP